MLLAAPASALSAAPTPRSHLNRTSAASIASTNDKVDALRVNHGVLYVGGKFTRFTWKGRTYHRHYLGAVRIATGAPTGLRPRINGEVYSLAVGPKRNTLYIGGKFTSVDGQPRENVAAINIHTRKLRTFAPDVSNTVRSIVPTTGGIYLGGVFATVGGTAQPYLARVSAQGVLDTTFAPVLDHWVRAMILAPDKSRLIVGGGFRTVDGIARNALASLDLTTGANEPFNPGLIPIVTKQGHGSQVTSLTKDKSVVYAGAEGTGHGVFDGVVAFDPDTGSKVWRNTCLGATQAVLYLNGTVYKASHAHDCSSMGDFGQIPSGWEPHRLLGLNPANGALLPWGTSATATRWPSPDVNGGLYNHLGPYALASNGRELFVGGEFTEVNHHDQEGLTRFFY